MTGGRLPDYNVTARIVGKVEIKGPIGAGWKNPDGSISVRLNPFIVVDHQAMIRLWPASAKPETKAQQARRVTGGDLDSHSDAPF